jgi:hypothetical protein
MLCSADLTELTDGTWRITATIQPQSASSPVLAPIVFNTKKEAEDHVMEWAKRVTRWGQIAPTINDYLRVDCVIHPLDDRKPVG